MEQRKKYVILVGIVLAMLLSALDQTIVSTAMPQIVQQLNGIAHLSWVFTAYMLTSTITVPIYGKLSDIFNRRFLYILGIIIFIIGSILSGMSQSMLQLIIFRGLQGIGGGAIMVNSIAMIGELFSVKERSKWQGLIGGVFGLASIAGPLLGGWITDNFSWRWIFYVNIPVGILAIVVLLASLPKFVSKVKERTVDYLGAVLLSLGLIPLLLALVWGGSQYSWFSWEIISMLSAAVIFLVSFFFVEKKSKEPILSFDLFKNKVFSISVLIMFMTSLAMFGAILYIPIFAQGVIKISATNSGLILMPMMITMIIGSAISGQIIAKLGKYKLLAILGMLVSVMGMYLFSVISIKTVEIDLLLRMVILGLGLGITMPIFTIAVQNAFPKERLGEVTAGTQLFRNIGGTVGTAVLGGVMNAELASRLVNIEGDPFVKAMQRFDSSNAFNKVDSNTIQGILNPDLQQKIIAIISKTPEAVQAQLTANYDHFLELVKVAFTSSLSNVFLVGTFLTAIALIAVFFLPQIEITTAKRPAAEELGIELETDLGQSDKAHELKV